VCSSDLHIRNAQPFSQGLGPGFLIQSNPEKEGPGKSIPIPEENSFFI
jgi:hypothetical protein